MGLASWIAAGLAAALLSLAARRHRLHFALELLIALIAAFIAGLVATALDFGGWSVLDARAIAFALLVPLAILPLVRLVRVTLRRS